MANEELPAHVHAAITRLCKEGDQLAKKRDDHAAHQKYAEAWELVPEDKAAWEASTWILAALGELFFQRGDVDEAMNCFLRAVQCPKGFGNPYIHLRIGQLQFEKGNLEGAGGNLARAFVSAGEEIFEREDPKYLSFLRTVLLPPADEDESKN